MGVEPYGQWAWVYACEASPDRSVPRVGKVGENCFCLPASFLKRVAATDLLRYVNSRFGTLLDYYEEEDVDDPDCLFFMAGQLEQAFRGHELESAVGELVNFLIDSARGGRCLTFWL